MQANGAEMTRLACCLATERGVQVCGPIHDAIPIEAPIDEIDAAVTTARAAREEASQEVLRGHVVPVDAEIVRWPDRYRPEDGREMWERVLRFAGVTEPVGVEACASLRTGLPATAWQVAVLPTAFCKKFSTIRLPVITVKP